MIKNTAVHAVACHVHFELEQTVRWAWQLPITSWTGLWTCSHAPSEVPRARLRSMWRCARRISSWRCAMKIT